jgi:hypothetical protein
MIGMIEITSFRPDYQSALSSTSPRRAQHLSGHPRSRVKEMDMPPVRSAGCSTSWSLRDKPLKIRKVCEGYYNDVEFASDRDPLGNS